jgi:hypothetical protein
VNTWCIISAATGPPEAQMPRADPPRADAAGLTLTALAIDQAALVLRRSGSQRATVEAIRADIAAGAPINADGTLNLIAYGAWLVRALANRESQHGG